ncbi:MAG: glycosyltransferase family 2 protein [Calditrichaeota bacterium]|nr:MAG: glycosyltransferase family 2 protein [Calditrichota bacterium]
MFAPNGTSSKQRGIRVDVVLPVYNEEKVLAKSVGILRRYLQEHCPYRWRIVIADNASNDATARIGAGLTERFDDVTYLHLPLKGRGRALRAAWRTSDADILSYMDVDLSTDLSCFMPMLRPLAQGRADLAIGSRYKKGAKVKRGLKREVLSRGYIGLIKLFFRCSFTDTQCGFKAITRRAVRTLVPLVENQGWFFDAELLLLAERYGFRVFEIPVRWTDDPDSRVNILQTVSEHFTGLLRMRLAFSTGMTTTPLDVFPAKVPA